MWAYYCPPGLIKDRAARTPDEVKDIMALAEKRFRENIKTELSREKACKDADLVIETMKEDPEAKAEVYESIRDLLPERTVIITNTSSLLPSMFADLTGRPEKYCAVHFSNLIWYCNSAEIMGHPGTDPAVIEDLVQFADEINMVPLVLRKEQPGYLLNSLLFPFLGAAQKLWANDVADPETIDRAWEIGMGEGTGPFKILDNVGLDTVYALNELVPDSKVPGTVWYKLGQLFKEKIDKGETGKAAGRGFYDYTK
ncbi:MAG: 3-hydroxyacyl-CoA dehydrogenase [Lachnospiraceae bacterium]|nr:3-hydroxyacyl-CoA dehydrogenase [Lachnospiraceae bacterium]